MMDEEILRMFQFVYESLRNNQQIIDETTLAMDAMDRALAELVPGYEQARRKHYLLLKAGADGRERADQLQLISEIAELLKKQADKIETHGT